MFSDLNRMKLEINNGNNWETRKYVDIKEHMPK